MSADRTTPVPPQPQLPVAVVPERKRPLRTHPTPPTPDHWKDAGEIGTADDIVFGIR